LRDVACRQVALVDRLDPGLVNALDAVGRNLFGTAVFSAFPVDPVFPGDPYTPVRLDLGDNTVLPVTVNVFNKQYPIDQLTRLPLLDLGFCDFARAGH
jgi:hypothetical protein